MADLSTMTKAEKEALLKQLQDEQRSDRLAKREAYEAVRGAFLKDVRQQMEAVATQVVDFKAWIDKNAGAFREVLEEYGRLRKSNQQNYTVQDGSFKLEVKCNKVKSFDERADVAAERLMEYLKAYVAKSDKGVDDPMYQLAMTLLERNKQGDLDYKSISKLYEMEDRFDDEYREIMELFRESNIVNTTTTNYYFYRRDDLGVWRRIEPSFCRL